MKKGIGGMFLLVVSLIIVAFQQKTDIAKADKIAVYYSSVLSKLGDTLSILRSQVYTCSNDQLKAYFTSCRKLYKSFEFAIAYRYPMVKNE